MSSGRSTSVCSGWTCSCSGDQSTLLAESRQSASPHRGIVSGVRDTTISYQYKMVTGKIRRVSYGRLAPRNQPGEVILIAAQDVVKTSVGAPLSHRLRVRYGECDPQGVVFSAHFLAYFDIGL